MSNTSHHLKKILILSMESSFRKKEINTLLLNLLNKIENNLLTKPEELENLKLEYEQLVKEIEENEKRNRFIS